MESISPNTLAPLRFDSLRIDPPIVQAPLAGYSDWPMRVIARKSGAPMTLSEVMLDRFVVQVSGGGKALRYIRVDGHPCGAQLMGSDADELDAAARRFVEAGFDLIDVNFACPVKKVIGKCRGGSLLGDPKKALAIFARVREAVPPEIPVTVKLRCGLDDSAESREKFFEILDGVFRLGAAGVTVHGRTVRQRYEGLASWEFLREVKQHVGEKTVVGSGDLVSAAACVRMIRVTGVDGVSAARGAIGNPWIFRQFRELLAGQSPTAPSLFEQRDVLREHFRLAEELYGADRASRMLRKFGIRYSRLHPRSGAVREAFIDASSGEDWQAVLKKWYSTDGPGRASEN